MKKLSVFVVLISLFVSCSMNYGPETESYTTGTPVNEAPSASPAEPTRGNLGATTPTTEPEETPVITPITQPVNYRYNFYYGTPESVSHMLDSGSTLPSRQGPPQYIGSYTRTTNGPTSITWGEIIRNVEYTVPHGFQEDYWWYSILGTDLNRLEQDSTLDLTYYNFYLTFYDNDNGIRAPFPDGLYHFVDSTRPELTTEELLNTARCFKVEGNYVYFDFGRYAGNGVFGHDLVSYLVVDYKYYPATDTNPLHGTALLLKKDDQYYGMYFAFTTTNSRSVIVHAPIPFDGPLPESVNTCVQWEDMIYPLYHQYYNINASYSLD